MRPKYIQNKQMNLFYPQLSEQLNPKHSLLQLAKTIPWNTFEEKFLNNTLKRSMDSHQKAYSVDGRIGHAYNTYMSVSDEQVRQPMGRKSL